MQKFKLAIIAGLVVVGLAIGGMISMTEVAMALPDCEDECLFETVVSMDTGTICEIKCAKFGAPYPIYRISTCTGGPQQCPYVHEVIACHNGDGGIYIGRCP